MPGRLNIVANIWTINFVLACKIFVDILSRDSCFYHGSRHMSARVGPCRDTRHCCPVVAVHRLRLRTSRNLGFKPISQQKVFRKFLPKVNDSQKNFPVWKRSYTALSKAKLSSVSRDRLLWRSANDLDPVNVLDPVTFGSFFAACRRLLTGVVREWLLPDFIRI